MDIFPEKIVFQSFFNNAHRPPPPPRLYTEMREEKFTSKCYLNNKAYDLKIKETCLDRIIIKK